MADQPEDASTPLDQVVDDYAPQQEAVEWATTELADGRSFDEVTGRLVQTGWSDADANNIVEQARLQTRHYRGALTREEIVRASNQRYSQGMNGGWFNGFPSIAAVRRLIHAIASLAYLNRKRPHDTDDSDV